MHLSSNIYCITGIDTDIGKTVATGLMARYYLQQGVRVITQKVVQTGCRGISEDILRHREIMGIELQSVDKQQLTCPYVFPDPCSPHLAAALAGITIDANTIATATETLLAQYDLVLLEGAGGLAVPLTVDYTLLDYLEEKRYPLVLVSSCRLGSINHTLTALELAKRRKLVVAAIIYNLHEPTDARIVADSKTLFQSYAQKNGFHAPVITLGELSSYLNIEGYLPDFQQLIDEVSTNT